MRRTRLPSPVCQSIITIATSIPAIVARPATTANHDSRSSTRGSSSRIPAIESWMPCCSAMPCCEQPHHQDDPQKGSPPPKQVAMPSLQPLFLRLQHARSSIASSRRSISRNLKARADFADAALHVRAADTPIPPMNSESGRSVELLMMLVSPVAASPSDAMPTPDEVQTNCDSDSRMFVMSDILLGRSNGFFVAKRTGRTRTALSQLVVGRIANYALCALFSCFGKWVNPLPFSFP